MQAIAGKLEGSPWSRLDATTSAPVAAGRGHKQCCAAKQTQAWTGRVMMGMVLVMLLGAVYAGITAVTSDPSSRPADRQRLVAEHGHYH